MESSTEPQFRVLYRQFLFRIVDLEILSARADIARLLSQFAAMLAALSLMFCGGALRILQSDGPSAETLISCWGDEHFLIATTMAVVGLFAVLSWDTALPNRRDVFVLAPLPIKRRTLFLAKLAATGSVLALTVLALNVFSGVSYPLAIGLATGGVFGVARAFAAYWITMLAAAAFMFGLMLGIRGLAAQLLSRQYFLRLSAGLQMAAFCTILAVYFLQPAIANPTALRDAHNAYLASWLPSYWFLGLFQQINGSPHELLSPLAGGAWKGLFASVGGATVVLLLSYVRTLRTMVEEPDVEPDRRGLNWIPSMGDSLRTPIFQFTARTLFRSHQHRIILACYVGIGFAIALAYLRTVLYGLYGYSGYSWGEVNRPVLVATVVMTCFAVVGARVAFAIPITLPANWIFRTAVTRYSPTYLTAIREVLLLLAVAPAVCLSFVLLLCIWPFWPVLGHVILLLLLGIILADLCLLRFRKIPFTCAYLPGKSQIHVTAGACIFVLVALADIGVEFETYALRHPVRYALMLGPIAVLAALLRWRTSEQMSSSEAVLVFEEEPAAAILTLDLQADSLLSRNSQPGLGNAPESAERALQRPASARRWPMRIAVAAVSLVVALLTSGTVYQRVAGELDLSAYPRPGRLINVGGHKLHLYCTGTGSPTVVLESGAGSGMLPWQTVQAQVSRWTRVCSYDRAGYGWSDLDSEPRTIRRVAEELRVLLDNGGESAPFVLVGHSLGGVYAQYLASENPDLVAGLILVDGTHEDTFEHLPVHFKLLDWSVKLAQDLRVAGISRLYSQSTDLTVRAFQNSNKQLQAMTAEEESMDANLADLRAAKIWLGNRPLVVLTSEQTNEIDFVRPLQVELVKRSNNSKLLVVQNSGHAIHRDRPDAVAAAIREVVEALRD